MKTWLVFLSVVMKKHFISDWNISSRLARFSSGQVVLVPARG
jgi:hypothetical protein